MKILFLVYYYFPNGRAATWSTYALSKRLARDNEVYLIVPNLSIRDGLCEALVRHYEERNPTLVRRVPFFRLPSKIAPLLSPLFLFLDGLKVGRRCDVILCQFQPHHFTFLVGVCLSKILGIPAVARANDVQRDMGIRARNMFQGLNLLRRRMFNTMNESFVKEADAFLLVCRELRPILESRTGRLDNLHLCYNGVDPQEFMGLSYEEARKLLSIRETDEVILFIGRFSGPLYKIDVLLKAFNIVSEEYPDALLILVGDRLPNAYRPLIGDSERVRILNLVSRFEIKKYVIAADVCIGTLGRGIGIPLKVLEYMIASKPVVTGVDSVSREVVDNGRNMMVVQPEPRDVARAVMKILGDGDFARSLGENARRTAENYTWDGIADRLEGVLRDAVMARMTHD